MSQASEEWTFEKAKKIWQPMTKAVQHVGVPGYEFQTGVMWNGSLLIGPTSFLDLEGMRKELEYLEMGDHFLFVTVGYGNPMRVFDRSGIGTSTFKRYLEDGHLPIPHLVLQDADLRWHQRVFAHLLEHDPADGMSPKPEHCLVAHSRFEVQSTGAERQTARLWLHFGGTEGVALGYKPRVAPEFTDALAHEYVAPFGKVDGKVRYCVPSPEKGEIVVHDELDSVRGVGGAAEKVMEWRVDLEPGESAALKLILPYRLLSEEKGRLLAQLDDEKLFEEVKAFWREVTESHGSITTPDPFVNDYVAAIAGQMAQQVACRQAANIWMYKTSPNHYEGYWPCNGAKALPAFDLRGLRKYSEPVLQSFVDIQSDDIGGLDRTAMGGGEKLEGEQYDKKHGFMGLFPGWTANPLLLSHGLGMWALATHYRIYRDGEWLGEGPGSPLQALLDAFDWITHQRKATMREEDGERVPQYGLLPPASAHDWCAGYTITNDASCIYGMIETVRLLRELAHPRAEELAGELASYRKDFREAYVRARDRAQSVPQADGSELPYVPRDVTEMDWRDVDWTITVLGPMRAGSWGAFDPQDELVDQALAFIKGDMPKGEGIYMINDPDPAGPGGNTHSLLIESADANFMDTSGPKAPDRHYHWKHYVEYETMWPVGTDFFLQRDDIDGFFEWLFNNLAVVLHHDWRVGVESLDGVPSCAPGDGERWQAIRNMFVNERGGYDGSGQSLWLLQAIPRCWLRPGDRLSVKRIRSRFGGPVDLELAVADDGGVEVSASFDFEVLPAEIRMRLRSGSGRRFASATINGESVAVADDDTIQLPRQKKGNYIIKGNFQ